MYNYTSLLTNFNNCKYICVHSYYSSNVILNYYIIIINFFVLKLKFLDYNLFWKSNFVYLPVKYKLFTVLKSPHSDKKSREQFHLLKYKSLCFYPIFFSLNNSFFFKSLFFFEYGGFEMINDNTIYRS